MKAAPAHWPRPCGAPASDGQRLPGPTLPAGRSHPAAVMVRVIGWCEGIQGHQEMEFPQALALPALDEQKFRCFKLVQAAADLRQAPMQQRPDELLAAFVTSFAAITFARSDRCEASRTLSSQVQRARFHDPTRGMAPALRRAAVHTLLRLAFSSDFAPVAPASAPGLSISRCASVGTSCEWAASACAGFVQYCAATARFVPAVFCRTPEAPNSGAS